MKFTLFSISLVAVVVALSAIESGDALPGITSALSCTKNYIVDLVRDKVINRSAGFQAFRDTMAKVNEEFEKEKLSDKWAKLSEEEKKNVYSKLVVEGLRELRDNLETGAIKEAKPQGAEDKLVDSCLKMEEDFNRQTESWDPNTEYDEEEELRLLSELDELTQEALLDESEMGWAMSEETKQQLSLRTRSVLQDLLSNEIKQLALAILNAYMAGTGYGTVFTILSGSFKLKVFQYLLNSILDIVSAAVGRKIEVKGLIPEPSTATPVAVAA